MLLTLGKDLMTFSCLRHTRDVVKEGHAVALRSVVEIVWDSGSASFTSDTENFDTYILVVSGALSMRKND
jgi:hypothetical protein